MSFNLLAIVIATVAGMLVGVIWFRPKVFGDRWQALTGVDPNKPRRPAVVFPLSFLMGAITAVTLSAAASSAVARYGGSPLVVTLVTASVLWLGFTAATAAVHYLFEGRHPAIFAINTGHQLVTALVMAVVIGLFGF